MADNKKDNGSNGLRAYIPVIVAIIGAFGGGVGANYLLVRETGALQEIARPDPFTGSQGQRLETRLTAIERDLADLRRNLEKLPPRELTDRVLRLELLVLELRKDIDQCCKQ